MLETAVLLDNPGGGGGAAAVAEPQNDGGGGEEEGGNQNSGGGNRWPHEETLTLLKIRSEMDLAFRDSTLKGPLWDEVSRKMEEFGYQRSAKKCREKFENIYKYHRRTKEGRSGRQTGKNYRFFEQLEVFDAMQSHNKIGGAAAAEPPELASPSPVAMIKPNTNIVQDFRMRPHGFGADADVLSASTSTTYSSGGSSGRKRKLAGYFEKMMKEVLEKQEDLQKKFLEAIERCENERMAREEAWKKQEIERLKREQESLAKERAIAEAKDAAVIAFLQKISKQPILVPHKPQSEDVQEFAAQTKENGSGDTTISSSSSSSRWPKPEIEALIQIRTNLDLQHHDNGSKGPLWEDISAEMKKLGYDRNAKRCKEKWENINKYYRRVKDSNKRRPEDSKTCPYFHILDSLYQTKSRKVELSPTPDLPNFNLKAGEMLLQIMTQNQHQQPGKEDGERSNAHQTQEHDEDSEESEDDEFQIVANQAS
ncbi:PREDICTED: trihelix transcription factor GT-2-like [Ipomoea nil]|uniref:trihelix transcription factor GT-2-like n=1 Tax=Ipomoea nil TaxID=35883 RepID=UPI000901E7A7|nr:PREDICTED: trihelix transcription factor GT-2-like [Ipomoea nil]